MTARRYPTSRRRRSLPSGRCPTSPPRTRSLPDRRHPTSPPGTWSLPDRRPTTLGQATIETVALVPLLVAVGLGVLQLLAVGYASVLAGNAAEAGALAIAAGADPRASAKHALPGWSRARARIEVEGGRVEVHLRAPSPLRALAEGLEVTADATVEAP